MTLINKWFARSEGITFKVIVTIVVAIVDHHMGVVVHVEKNMVEDVLLDGGSKVNAITYGLR